MLDVKDGQALLISERVLDCVRYNEEWKNVTWENCTLRKWMNDSFYNTAFSENEKSGIVLTSNINLNNPSFGTPAGNDTDDYVFCLSVYEAEKYFSDDLDRKALATEYTMNKHVFSDHSSYRWWVLRTPGGTQGDITRVTNAGDIDYNGAGGYTVDNGESCVRPAIWVTLSN